MWHSRTLAAAAVAAALATGAGCVTQSRYNRDLAAEQQRTEAGQLKVAALQGKLDQARKDVKKAWDEIAAKENGFTANQKLADNALQQISGLKQQVEQLQNSAKNSEESAKAAASKAEKAKKENAEQLKKLQDDLDAARKDDSELRALTEKQKAQIAELQARLEGNSSSVAPPAAK